MGVRYALLLVVACSPPPPVVTFEPLARNVCPNGDQWETCFDRMKAAGSPGTPARLRLVKLHQLAQHVCDENEPWETCFKRLRSHSGVEHDGTSPKSFFEQDGN